MNSLRVGRGYIALHREALDCWQFTKDKWWRMWSYILLNTKYADNGEYKRGEFLYDRDSMANQLKIPPREVKDFITRCVNVKDLEWIERPSGPRPVPCPVLYRLKVVKWDTYQVSPSNLTSGSRPVPCPVVSETLTDSDTSEPLNKEIKKEYKNSCGISSRKPKPARAKKVKDEKEQQLNEAVKKVLAFMWDTYEERYGLKPDSGKVVAMRVRQLVKKYGSRVVATAWLEWLNTHDDWVCQKSHAPNIFVSSQQFTIYAAKAKVREGKTIAD